jgi:hypothetical protein
LFKFNIENKGSFSQESVKLDFAEFQKIIKHVQHKQLQRVLPKKVRIGQGRSQSDAEAQNNPSEPEARNAKSKHSKCQAGRKIRKKANKPEKRT